MNTVKIGMAQMLVEGGEPDTNLSRAVSKIKQASKAGCDLVLLPECMDLGWTDPRAQWLAQPIPGLHFDRLASAAKENNIFVVAGLVERCGAKLYNAAVLIDRDGSIAHLHRKINELNIAHDLYSVGDRLGVVDTELGRLGINICADNFPNSLAIGHVLARMGAQIILSPSAWAVDADHDNEKEPYGQLWQGAYKELSRLYDIPVIGVSSVGWLREGPWKGRKVIGCSLAIGADGHVLVQGPYGERAESLIIVDVELPQRLLHGTLVADELQRRGYTGP